MPRFKLVHSNLSFPKFWLKNCHGINYNLYFFVTLWSSSLLIIANQTF